MTIIRSLFIVMVASIGIRNIVESRHLRSIVKRNSKLSDACQSPIYCRGELLKTVQLARIFKDSKTFVDLSQNNDPSVTLANFQLMMNATHNKPTRDEVEKFVLDNFSEKDELKVFNLTDWQKNPNILKKIKDPDFRKWARDLNGIWKDLSRKIDDKVRLEPNKHSLIYVDEPFIVPGGRFKEFYYWDSYWVIKGLLLCGMKQTPKGMINNFLSMVDRYGFIPNGGRIYYLMRSQPPLLIPMVSDYIKYTGDSGYLKSIINTLVKEFNFWHLQRLVEIIKNGKSYYLARYIVDSEGPRPESYREDYELAEAFTNPERKKIFYDDIKAAAESGWDFSYRWVIANENETAKGLSDVHTRYIIPVDLNAHLERNARLLSEFHMLLGKPKEAAKFKLISAQYQDAIDAILWNDMEGMWFDYDILNNKPRKDFYPTNLTPLYTKSYTSDSKAYGKKAVNYLKKQGIDQYLGGTPASLNHTNEQWDFPNAWPPLQSFIVLGLQQTGLKEAIQMSKLLATRWLRSNWSGYKQYHKMFEKYDATNPGQGGGGGEYITQDGFGWTNGVVLEFLDLFPGIRTTDTLLNQG